MSWFEKNTNFDPIAKVGMRIRMGDTDAFNPEGLKEKNPVKPDMEGTIDKIDSIGTLHVLWDPDENGSQRYFGVIPNIDDYTLLPSLKDQVTIDSFNESKEINPSVGKRIDSDLKKTANKIKPINPKKLKAFESEKDLEETVVTGSAAGPYYGPLGSRKNESIKVKDFISETTGVSAISATVDFLISNLMGWGTIEDMSPPWPSLTKKADNNKKEDWWWQKIPTYNGGVITDPYAKTNQTWDDDSLEVDVDQDLNIFRKEVEKNPKKYKQSVITIDKGFDLNIDPRNEDWKSSLQKGVDLKNDHTTGEIQTFRNKSYSRTLKKEDITNFLDNLISEGKKKDKKTKVHTKKWDRCVEAVKMKNKENGTDYNPYSVCQSSIGYEGSIKKPHRRQEVDEEGVNETTTFGSVFGGGFPVTPMFAAKKGQHRPSKKPLWKGGQIIQKVDGHGIFNESEEKVSLLDEINKVKWTKGAKYVKIKDKCAKYNNQPWCSQGAIDNPLELSDKTFESVSNLAKKLGLSEEFILDKINKTLNKK